MRQVPYKSAMSGAFSALNGVYGQLALAIDEGVEMNMDDAVIAVIDDLMTQVADMQTEVKDLYNSKETN